MTDVGNGGFIGCNVAMRFQTTKYTSGNLDIIVAQIINRKYKTKENVCAYSNSSSLFTEVIDY